MWGLKVNGESHFSSEQPLPACLGNEISVASTEVKEPELSFYLVVELCSGSCLEPFSNVKSQPGS